MENFAEKTFYLNIFLLHREYGRKKISKKDEIIRYIHSNFIFIHRNLFSNQFKKLQISGLRCVLYVVLFLESK